MLDNANLGSSEFAPLAELFKAFSDETRLKIMNQLATVEEMCVGDLAMKLEMTDSAISHQLKILKQAHLVKGRRDGKLIYYSLDDNHVKTMFLQGLEHIRE